MTSSELIDLAVNGVTGIRRGKAMALSSRLAPQRAGLQRGVTTHQRAFLDNLLSQPKAAPQRSYAHPESASSQRVDRKMDRLAPADIAWLDRLPKDPATVSLEDAATIRGLLTALQNGHASQSDQRLVASYWQPIKQHHDKAQAEHNLRLASRPLSNPYDHGALAAVAEAMRHEDPSLDDEISRIKANRAIEAARQARLSEQDRQLAWAKRDLDSQP